MKKTFILILLLIAATQFSFAQNDHLISLKNFNLTTPRFPFRVEQVLDGRAQRKSIGFVRKGLGNALVVAQLKEGVEQEIFKLFERSYPAQSPQKPIDIRVNQLEIYESATSSNEISGVELNISFLEKKGETYNELYNIGTLVESSGMEVTKKHNDNIVTALEFCLQKFLHRHAKGQLWNRPFDIQIPSEALFGNYPILQNKTPTLGYYRTFEDFRDNLISTDKHFILTNDPERSKNNWVGSANWIDHDNIQRIDSIWGLCDGKYYYLKSGQSFFRLENIDDEFTLQLKTPKKSSGMGAILGGMIGALIEEAIVAQKGDVEPYRLHLENGSVTPVKDKKKKKQVSTVYIYCSNYSKSEVPGKIKIGSKIIGDFAPDCAFKVNIPLPAGKMDVCIDGENYTCEPFNLKPFYLYWIGIERQKKSFSVRHLDFEEISQIKDKLEKKKIALIEVE